MRKIFFTKYLVRLLIPLLVPLLLLGSFSILITQSYMKKDINNSNVKMLEQTKNTVESIFHELDPLYYTLNLNSQLISSLKQLLRSEGMEPVNTDVYRTFMNVLNPPASIKPYVHSIYIYIHNDTEKFLASNEGLTSRAQFYDTSWLEVLPFIPNETNVFIENRSIRRFESKDTQLVTIFRKFNAPGVSRAEGYIVMNIKSEGLTQLLDEHLYFPHQSIVLLHKDHRLIAGTNQELIHEFEIAAPQLEGESSLYEVKASSGSYVVSSITSDNYGIEYVSATPKPYFYQLPIRLVYLSIAMIIFSLLIGIVLVYYLSKRNYNSLRTIIRTIENGENGLPVPELPEKVTDEYSYIMQRTVKRFMEQRYLQVQLSEKKYKLQSMEMMALQSNINPHFLANTLRTIFWKSMDLTGGHNETSEMIDYLAEIVQYSISDSNKTVTLREEIFHTNNYIKILKIRYKDKFDFSWDYDEEMLDYQVMKLLFQPLVENAIYHGIKESARFGYIQVKLRMVEEQLNISIIDTGIGMKKERLHQVRKLLANSEEFTGHIGIYNTYKRLQLMHAGNNHFAIFSKYGWGTVIRVAIPAHSFIG